MRRSLRDLIHDLRNLSRRCAPDPDAEHELRVAHLRGLLEMLFTKLKLYSVETGVSISKLLSYGNPKLYPPAGVDLDELMDRWRANRTSQP
jgi:hypothetical protein